MSEILRQQARHRSGGRCEYCRLPDGLPPLEPFHLEHVTARQHGGATEPENLAWACHRCNFHKGPNLSGIDPVTKMIVRLFHPRRDVWSEHFVLIGVRIVGLSAIGRATVSLLQMNAPRRLERRAELVKREWF